MAGCLAETLGRYSAGSLFGSSETWSSGLVEFYLDGGLEIAFSGLPGHRSDPKVSTLLKRHLEIEGHSVVTPGESFYIGCWGFSEQNTELEEFYLKDALQMAIQLS